MHKFPLAEIELLQKKLALHPIYASLTNSDDLVKFMQHHVYCVWDFMSLVKYLQAKIAPVNVPWIPSKNSDIQHFINAIVLEEESDQGIVLKDNAPTYTSHFQLYIQAMEEVREGSSQTTQTFVQNVATSSLEEALANSNIPQPSQKFTKTTFSFIASDKPHVVAAAFAFGREHIIPSMFRALLEKMEISKEDASTFHYYLDRHIELDGDFHGPMALEMVDLLCQGDKMKIQEAKDAAITAINSRIEFWDEVLLYISRGNV